jgi:hypothetical protein
LFQGRIVWIPEGSERLRCDWYRLYFSKLHFPDVLERAIPVGKLDGLVHFLRNNQPVVSGYPISGAAPPAAFSTVRFFVRSSKTP